MIWKGIFNFEMKSVYSHRLMFFFLALMLCIHLYIKNHQLDLKELSVVIPDSSASHLAVMVTGAVNYPGIYFVPANTVTDGVIKMAKSAEPLVEDHQMGDHVISGSRINVVLDQSGMRKAVVDFMSVKQRIILKIPLDISKLGENELADVPGIGPILAKNILFYRQMIGGRMSREQLANVSGIGDKKFNQLKKYFN